MWKENQVNISNEQKNISKKRLLTLLLSKVYEGTRYCSDKIEFLIRADLVDRSKIERNIQHAFSVLSQKEIQSIIS